MSTPTHENEAFAKTNTDQEPTPINSKRRKKVAAGIGAGAAVALVGSLVVGGIVAANSNGESGPDPQMTNGSTDNPGPDNSPEQEPPVEAPANDLLATGKLDEIVDLCQPVFIEDTAAYADIQKMDQDWADTVYRYATDDYAQEELCDMVQTTIDIWREEAA
ncbi:MAG: hypothetical protein ACSLE3_04165 [Microbacteriaceae bacterium]